MLLNHNHTIIPTKIQLIWSEKQGIENALVRIKKPASDETGSGFLWVALGRHALKLRFGVRKPFFHGIEIVGN